MSESEKIIAFPFRRDRNIENAVNAWNVATYVQEEVPDNGYAEGSNILNELNDLLNNIHGESQLIELWANKEEIDKVLLIKSTYSLKQNCLKLMKVLNNMNDIKKIEENQFSLFLNNVNIVEVLDNICINVSKNIENKNIVFDTNLEEKYLQCDVDKLQKSILILLAAAVKFSSENKIFVNLSVENNVNITISFKSKNNKLPGILADKTDKLGLDTTKDLSVDLYICKNIIDLHEGSLEIVGNDQETEVNFSIQLPCENTDSIYYIYGGNNSINDENLRSQIEIAFSDAKD